jgi:hypothetical protein
LKRILGYGNVRKVKNKKAVILSISGVDGLLKVLNLIRGKIRHENKINQINNYILARPFFKSLPKFILNTDNNLDNYWLAGFTDADGSFQIKVLKRIKRIEIRLNFQVDQKKEDLLILIKKTF